MSKTSVLDCEDFLGESNIKLDDTRPTTFCCWNEHSFDNNTGRWILNDLFKAKTGKLRNGWTYRVCCKMHKKILKEKF